MIYLLMDIKMVINTSKTQYKFQKFNITMCMYTVDKAFRIF